jgi:hypothetical protein
VYINGIHFLKNGDPLYPTMIRINNMNQIAKNMPQKSGALIAAMLPVDAVEYMTDVGTDVGREVGGTITLETLWC